MTDQTSVWNEPRIIGLLWIGLLAGPLGWSLDVGISYALVQWACEMNHPNVLHLLSVLGLLVVGGGAAVSYWCLQRTPADSTLDGGASADRSRFMAILGLSLNALFLLVVVANAIPRFILSPCHQ